uniref:Pre-mRNA-splicing factor SPF27 n=1 Tax=Pyrodinium bahamense TaxID=73915 RepID=A0A7S0FWU8_9DINO|mmetsp:Transcript_52237/g.144632  ORF Transcript_52237/g.144632 Transcript_52237/m.144632 type:complete len:241 (+) Transcript_52237:99-821(+)
MDGDDRLLFMENEHYTLVDALPYIDTQLGHSDVAQQVKALIEEEMRHFEPRDYLASLPPPELPLLCSEQMQQEFARIEAGQHMSGVDSERYKVEQPQGNAVHDHGAWRRAAENVQMQLEYNRLRLTNLEMLERWGNKAWVAHSVLLRASERVLANEAVALRASREEVNKKRKLDQISCGNELRKLGRELEQYLLDNRTAEAGLQEMEAEIKRLRQAALERGVDISDVDPEMAATAMAAKT